MMPKFLHRSDLRWRFKTLLNFFLVAYSWKLALCFVLFLTGNYLVGMNHFERIPCPSVRISFKWKPDAAVLLTVNRISVRITSVITHPSIWSFSQFVQFDYYFPPLNTVTSVNGKDYVFMRNFSKEYYLLHRVKVARIFCLVTCDLVQNLTFIFEGFYGGPDPPFQAVHRGIQCPTWLHVQCNWSAKGSVEFSSFEAIHQRQLNCS